MSIANLYKYQGKPEEARALLEPIYNSFTDGFDTIDLREAKALLDELSLAQLTRREHYHGKV